MNQSQIHLALTHMPVVLSLTGLVLLIISLVKKNQAAARISFYILLAAGLFTLPVFFSGEGAEEIVENLPAVSEPVIERHEDLATISLWVILATAMLALMGLLKLAGKPFFQYVKFPVLLLSFMAAGLMVYTAHLGGQIRHSEIRPGFASSNIEANNTGSENNGNQKMEATDEEEKEHH